MKHSLILFFAIAKLSLGDDSLSLWYRQPAQQWVEALPVGNGRLGAMVFGGVNQERIQFNESTVWSGEPHEYQHPAAFKVLGPIRNLLFAGKQKEAETLANQEFMSIPLGQKEYQAFGDILLDFSKSSQEEVIGYRRALNLDSATATVEYTRGGVKFTREAIASWPAQAIAIRLTASKPGALNFTAALKSAHSESAITAAGNQISMNGRVAESAIRFEARLAVEHNGGKHEAIDGGIHVLNANSATLILFGATNFKNFRDVSADPKQRNSATFAAIRGRSYETLRAAHLADHRKLFRRVSLDLGSSASSTLPTDERIKSFAAGNDPHLVSVLFQYGRYLMIGSSRQGGQPANLQGIWNDSNRPPWGSKYTDNINTEMNYWPAEVTNLAECHEPLFDALKDLAISGEKTASEQYNARGWVLHHNFDLWRGTAPINNANHGIWQTGGAWLSHHLWDHYLFSGDEEFLRKTAYPLIKSSAMFFVDALVDDSRTGKLISGPSNSPEQGGLVMGPTMDHQIIRSLFGIVIAAAKILDKDPEFQNRLVAMRARIAPNQIGRHGQLQEWLEDVDDPKNNHRHVSPLWGVYPGADITAYGSPDLFAAARKSLEFRGDAATGWSMGWKVNLWARFLDGAHSYLILQNLIRPVGSARQQGGLYPNLFDAHPPFQIDGNFGATSGIAEMLLQSHDPRAKPTDLTAVQSGQSAFVHLLPALPPAFADGKVTGLRARGGMEVDIEWTAAKLRKATIRANQTKPVRVRYSGKEIEIQAQAGKTYVLGPSLIPAREEANATRYRSLRSCEKFHFRINKTFGYTNVWA